MQKKAPTTEPLKLVKAQANDLHLSPRKMRLVTERCDGAVATPEQKRRANGGKTFAFRGGQRQK
jgi:hypothetical protein